MYAPNRTPVNGPHFPWYVAIDLPGAGQMKYLRNLIESRPMFDRVPDQSLITDALDVNDHIQATRGKDYIFVYHTQGKKFTLNTGKISGAEIQTSWYNPRNGEVKRGWKIAEESNNRNSPLLQRAMARIGCSSLMMLRRNLQFQRSVNSRMSGVFKRLFEKGYQQ